MQWSGNGGEVLCELVIIRGLPQIVWSCCMLLGVAQFLTTATVDGSMVIPLQLITCPRQAVSHKSRWNFGCNCRFALHTAVNT